MAPFYSSSAFSSAASPAILKAAVFLSAVGAGANLGISAFVIPRLLESPTGLMLRQWKHLYDTGKTVFLGASTSAALVYVASFLEANRSSSSSPFRLAPSRRPLAAAALCLSLAPYTLLVLRPTNQKLMARAVEAEADAQLTPADRAAGAGQVYTAEEEQSSKYLVDRWGLLNVGRSALMGAAAVVGLSAL